MKQLSRIIVLFLPGADLSQIVAVMAIALIFLKVTSNKLLGDRRERKIKRIKNMEDKIWGYRIGMRSIEQSDRCKSAVSVNKKKAS